MTATKPPVLIAVMGQTGSGKSTFINVATQSDKLRVGHSITSCTSTVDIADPFELDGRQVVLYDTPGFNDTNQTEADVLRIIASELEIQYRGGSKLHGIIYIHRISDVRVGGIDKANFGIFRKLCGDKSLKNVIILTNMWSQVSKEKGEGRVRELETLDGFFKPAIAKGARLMHHTKETVESAHVIIRSIIANHPEPLVIQRELVDEKKDIDKTAAGQEVDKKMAELVAEYEKKLREQREAMEQAQRERDEETRQELLEAAREAEEKIMKIEAERMSQAEQYRRLQAEALERKPPVTCSFVDTLAGLSGVRFLAQTFIDQSEVRFDEMAITEITQDAFKVDLNRGSVTSTGPFPGDVNLGDLAVKWNDTRLGIIKGIGSIHVEMVTGKTGWNPTGTFVITNKSQFAVFLWDLLSKERVTFTVESSTLSLKPILSVAPALQNLTLSNKKLTFDASQGLPDICVRDFDLLRRSNGGIDFSASLMFYSRSQVGIEFVGAVSFQLYSGDLQENELTRIGSLRTKKLSLLAKSNNQLDFDGHIDNGPTEVQLRVAGTLVAKYLRGEDQIIVFKDGSITPNLTWVVPVFNKWSMVVTLPGFTETVIKKIKFLEVLDVTREGLIGPGYAIITYVNPFGYPFNILHVSINLCISYKGIQVAKVQLPRLPIETKLRSSRGIPGTVQIAFGRQALQVTKPKMFWDSVVRPSGTTCVLFGDATVDIEIPIGNVPIAGLQFSCNSVVKTRLV